MPYESREISLNVKSVDTTVDFTATGFGTPDAVVIYTVREMLNDGRVSDDNQWSVTLWDGTRTRCVCAWDENGVGTTDSRTTASTSAVVLNGNFAGAFEYTISSITNGIRLTKVNNNLADTAVSVVLMKGLNSVRVDTFTPDATSGNDVNVTAPGFQPDYLMTLSPGGAPWNSGVSGTVNDALWAIGHVARDGSSFNLVSVSWGSDNGQSNTDTYIDVRDSTYIARNVLASLQVLEFRSFDPTGFTVRSGSNRAGNRDVAYLAIELDPADKAVTFSDQARTSTTGPRSYTTPDVNPDTLFIFGTRVPVASLNSLRTAGISETFGFYVKDSAHSEVSGGGMSEYIAATTNTFVYSDTGRFVVYEPLSASPGIAANYLSTGTEEFTMNWTVVSPIPVISFLGVAIGEIPASSNQRDLMPFFTHMASKGML